MGRPWIIALVLLAFAAGIAAYGWRHNESSSTQVEPSGLLDVAFSDLSGMPHDLKEWKGKILVVNFWATWCAPCRQETPEFSRLQDEYGERGLQFVGIAIDEVEAVDSFRQSIPINYPVLIGDTGGADYAFRLGNYLNVLPFSAVFDRNGILTATHPGAFSRQQVLAAIQRLL